MRVISGEFRGRPLAAPKGDQVTRPTTDRVRESLMSSIASARGGFEGAVVLDAFAGSGALGIEALSRGARIAVLCDRDRAALDACRKNSSFIGADRVSVVRADVLRFVPACPAGPYDLVFLDPPYAVAADAVAGMVGNMLRAGQIAPGALFAYEHAQKLDPASMQGFAALQLTPYATKAYGKKTVIDIFRKDAQ